jgi:hypothetical protein
MVWQVHGAEEDGVGEGTMWSPSPNWLLKLLGLTEHTEVRGHFTAQMVPMGR